MEEGRSEGTQTGSRREGVKTCRRGEENKGRREDGQKERRRGEKVRRE